MHVSGEEPFYAILHDDEMCCKTILDEKWLKTKLLLFSAEQNSERFYNPFSIPPVCLFALSIAHIHLRLSFSLVLSLSPSLSQYLPFIVSPFLSISLS